MTPAPALLPLRDTINSRIYADPDPILAQLIETAALSPEDRRAITARAADLVRDIRAQSHPGLMEVFLAEYGLSTDEGVALMCLAEALLRVPDAETIDALIEDKIAPSDWGKHLGKSNSSLVNASTWALMLTGRVLEDAEPGIVGTLRGAVKRLGEPVIRTAVARAMKEMGRQFVLGETIDSAMERAAKMEANGYTYSYDMLGEAARTEADAKGYHAAYARAIAAIARAATHDSVAENPGISVKLSALHPRYEIAKSARVMGELVPRVLELARQAKAAGMGFNIDAEEADRLDLSLDVIEAVLRDESLAGWEGFGIVVQAYGPRTGSVLDWIHALATELERRVMVRLVKGAYWDSEVKQAQVEGLEGFPVYTRKTATDISYIANARKMLGMTDRLYPQFATHNAHTVAAVLHMAGQMGLSPRDYEFQRLHGMGETLHNLVMGAAGTHCRIYAPVGAHRDLLAYLVRRLLENGANSSFVNQIVDEDVPPEVVATCPFDTLGQRPDLATGPKLFGARQNSKGWDLTHRPTLAAIDAARAPFRTHHWQASPLPARLDSAAEAQEARNPADPADLLGEVRFGDAGTVQQAFHMARPWRAPAAERARVLRAASDAYEAHFGEIFALLAREAGKTLLDAEGEMREAVDFLRYYADEAEKSEPAPRGTFACISPWNFPLAIFTGQIAAALAAGNAVIAKPAEDTTLVAYRAVELLHGAGVPDTALQLVPGAGDVGAAISCHPDLAGLAFTGSTATARRIRAAMAENAAPGTPLIAETGGLNAMIVDSTALPEAVVRDVIQSAFQSAGQRCSALRCLYLQEDVADSILTMIRGAMDELAPGNAWDLSTDLGPVITEAAHDSIQGHIDQARAEGRLLHQLAAPGFGSFVGPAMIAVPGIEALEREVFGPVLHVARFRAADLDKVIATINATGYGLTFGLHTRIDDRVQHVIDRVEAGNTYVNRNQIGAIVGSQPFGGEGLSGTGPKAGGPRYLPRFAQPAQGSGGTAWAQAADLAALKAALAAPAPEAPIDIRDMPGPTGESNRLSAFARGPVLCMGPGPEAEAAQIAAVRAFGGMAVGAGGAVPPEALTTLPLAAALWWGDAETGRAYEQALATRGGPLVALITDRPDAAHVLHERHICIDTTASGGNAALLAEVATRD